MLGRRFLSAPVAPEGRTMSSVFQSALRTVDAGLENVALIADDVDRSAAPLPPVTSDYNEYASESYLHKAIDALRSQVQRGLPFEASPLQLIVCFLFPIEIRH